MKSVNALTLRQSLGGVLRQLERGGEPILVQRGRQPAAVLIKEMRFRRPAGRTTLDRDLRSGRA